MTAPPVGPSLAGLKTRKVERDSHLSACLRSAGRAQLPGRFDGRRSRGRRQASCARSASSRTGFFVYVAAQGSGAATGDDCATLEEVK